MLPWNIVMLRRAGKEAVVFMRPSCAEDCELKGGAAFVNAQNTSTNSSVERELLRVHSFIFIERS